MTAYRHPLYETRKPSGDEHIVTDEYLDRVKEALVQGAVLAEKAGFDGVDVKACHGYLFSELLSARSRDSLYSLS